MTTIIDGNRISITHADGNASFATLYDGVNRPRQLLANGTASLASTSTTAAYYFDNVSRLASRRKTWPAAAAT